MVSHEAIQKAQGIIGFLTHLNHWAYFIRWGVPLKISIRPAVTTPRVFNFFKALRHAAGETPIGAAGFCWGGKHVFLLAADTEKIDGRSLIDSGFTAHPSMLEIPSDIEAVQKPLSVACGGNDRQLPVEKAMEIKRVLEEKKNKGGEHEFVMYETAHHGFAIRGSKEDPEENKQGQAAEDQAVEWFERWLV
jgi:dienelactone hydrolase